MQNSRRRQALCFARFDYTLACDQEQGERMDRAQATVFVVVDAQEVRIGLSGPLAAAGYQVRSFESAERFLEEPDAEIPGCLLLDVYLPGLGGLDLQRALEGSPCARPIVFLTERGDIKTGVQAMKAGAIDFLTTPIDEERLLSALDQACRCDAEQRQERAIRSMIQQRFETLTLRERQVMTHVIRGRLNRQIAVDLGTGEKTIKVHRGRVMSKMRAGSVAELVRIIACAGVQPELSEIAEPASNAPEAASLPPLMWAEVV
jgi:FixJ family two-component response regulator